MMIAPQPLEDAFVSYISQKLVFKSVFNCAGKGRRLPAENQLLMAQAGQGLENFPFGQRGFPGRSGRRGRLCWIA